jgi:hypothetical protein
MLKTPKYSLAMCTYILQFQNYKLTIYKITICIYPDLCDTNYMCGSGVAR